MSYHEFLRSIPPGKGVQLEFCRLSYYLWGMTRQHRRFKNAHMSSEQYTEVGGRGGWWREGMRAGEATAYTTALRGMLVCKRIHAGACLYTDAFMLGHTHTHTPMLGHLHTH